MLKTIVPKFHHDLLVPLKDIAEKQVPVLLKPIVDKGSLQDRDLSSYKYLYICVVTEYSHIL